MYGGAHRTAILYSLFSAAFGPKIPTSEGELVRIAKIPVMLLVIVLAASMALPAFAQDGAATFKAKCAGCHGPEGQGKIGPTLKGTA
jgi:mono/diheme cytochrome c family protein